MPVPGQDEAAIGSIPAPFGPPLSVREVARLGDKADGSSGSSDTAVDNETGMGSDTECIVRRRVGDGAINGPCSFGSVLCDRQHSFFARAFGSTAQVMGVDLGGDQRMLEVRFDLVETTQRSNSATDEDKDADSAEAGGDAGDEGSAAHANTDAVFGLCGELLSCGEHDVTIRLERQPPLGASAARQPLAGTTGDATADGAPEEGNGLVHELTLRGSGSPFAFPPEMC